MAEANVANNNQLPPEVLTKIFEHCDLNELVNIVDVCQLWRDVVIHQHMSVNDLVIRHPDDINNLVSLLCKPVSLTNLHVLWSITGKSRKVPQYTVRNPTPTSLTQLQSFSFEVKECTTFEVKECTTFAVKECTTRYYHSLLDDLLTLLRKASTDTLTHFKLIGISIKLTRHRPMAKKVVEVIGACQHLSHLVLKGCDVDRHRCVHIIPTLTHLELLDLRDTSVSDNDLSFIAAIKRSCPNICNNIMIDGLRVTPSCDVSMLQFVSHVGALHIDKLGTEQLTTLISCLNECASQLSVHYLDLQQSCKDYLTDDILLSLVQRLRGLRWVNAYSCHQLTNEGVANVITASPQLEKININGIQNIDTGIIQLLDHVVTKKNVIIRAYSTKLSDQMMNGRNLQLYTGKNRNVCLKYSGRCW